ncbi:uncharacterized protein LOC115623057 [Scaptodrosophila lebanonensis]|uniref:Uncharacterized protein LOC115623057 n=1 Tax=Drosophila lebanonensis TaxID=7225 RepID=A0A6J2T833_DROLE|nr:uncharacterized protein LOC115623057 [Scaptodrosophila lebanonensis]
MPKFLYCLLFLALTTLHICAHLHPVVEANATIKSNYPEVDRSMKLKIGYEYQNSMLIQALFHSALVLVGVWRCRRHTVNTEEQLLQLVASRPNILKTSFTDLTPALKLKQLGVWLWYEKRRLLPLQNYFSWFHLPWLITAAVCNVLNYMRLNLVMQHFCATQLEVLVLYIRMQLLFLGHVAAAALQPYWTHMADVVQGLSTAHVSYISYDTGLLL